MLVLLNMFWMCQMFESTRVVQEQVFQMLV